MGCLTDVGMVLRDQASLAALTEDVVKASEIEGEQLNVESCVRVSPAGWVWTTPSAFCGEPASVNVHGVPSTPRIQMVADHSAPARPRAAAGVLRRSEPARLAALVLEYALQRIVECGRAAQVPAV